MLWRVWSGLQRPCSLEDLWLCHCPPFQTPMGSQFTLPVIMAGSAVIAGKTEKRGHSLLPFMSQSHAMEAI